MQAVFCSGIGGQSKLTFGDAPEPELAADKVLIRVELVSIEAIDLVKLALYRTGMAEVPAEGVVGCQATGTVIAVGSRVTRFLPGDRVVAYDTCGSHAELFAAPESSTWLLPQGLGSEIGAAPAYTLAAAHGTLFTRGGLRAGETVLINHATSSLGIVAAQLAAQAGATVIGVTRDGSRHRRLSGLGPHHLLSLRGDDVIACCLELTDGKGVDFVFDVSAGERFSELARLVIPGGRYASISVAGEISPPAYGREGANAPLISRFTITPAGPMRDRQVHAEVTRLLDQVGVGAIQLPIEHEFALCEAAEAYDFILGGLPFGHVVMRP